MTVSVTNDLASDPRLDHEHPWPGPSAFRETWQSFFHGRSEEAEELLRRVRRQVVTVLFGRSGLGKTSLLRAGLFPKLRQVGMLPIEIRIFYSEQDPDPALQLKNEITQKVVGAGLLQSRPFQDEDTLWECFHRPDSYPKAGDGKPVKPVLVLDQFEEFFALAQGGRFGRFREAGFVEELADLIENRVPTTLKRRLKQDRELSQQFDFDQPDFRVLLCLREDYLANLEGLRQRLPSLADNRMRLTRLNGWQAHEAVIKPGGHLLSSPKVAKEIIRFVNDNESVSTDSQTQEDDMMAWKVEPWLLSLVCFQLNNRRGKVAAITEELVAGSSKNILETYYEDCLNRLSSAARAVLRKFIEERLASKTGIRERVTLDAARGELESQGVPISAIDQLVGARLLYVEAEHSGTKRLELTHARLAEVVLKTREERHRKDAEEKNLREAQTVAAEAVRLAEEKTRKAREKSQRDRRMTIMVVFFLCVVMILLLFSAYQWWELDVTYSKSMETYGKLEQSKVELDRAYNELEKTSKHRDGLKKDLDNFENKAISFLDNYRTAQTDSAYLEALKYLAELKKTDPRDSLLVWERNLHEKLGLFHMKRGEFAKAEIDFEQVLKLDKDRANKLEEKGRLTNVATSYARLAWAQFVQEKIEEAVMNQERGVEQFRAITEKPDLDPSPARDRLDELKKTLILKKGNFPGVISLCGFLSPNDRLDKDSNPTRTYPVTLEGGKTYEIKVLGENRMPPGSSDFFGLRLKDSKGTDLVMQLAETVWTGTVYHPTSSTAEGEQPGSTDSKSCTLEFLYDGKVKKDSESMGRIEQNGTRPDVRASVFGLVCSPFGNVPFLESIALILGRTQNGSKVVLEFDNRSVRMIGDLAGNELSGWIISKNSAKSSFSMKTEGGFFKTAKGVHRITVSGVGDYRLKVAKVYEVGIWCEYEPEEPLGQPSERSSFLVKLERSKKYIIEITKEVRPKFNPRLRVLDAFGKECELKASTKDHGSIERLNTPYEFNPGATGTYEIEVTSLRRVTLTAASP